VGGRAGKDGDGVVGAASVFVDEEERRLPRLEPDDDELGGVGGQLDVDDIGRALRVVADVGRRHSAVVAHREIDLFVPVGGFRRVFLLARIECPPPRQKRSTAQKHTKRRKALPLGSGRGRFRKAHRPVRGGSPLGARSILEDGGAGHIGEQGAGARVALPAKGDGKLPERRGE